MARCRPLVLVSPFPSPLVSSYFISVPVSSDSRPSFVRLLLSLDMVDLGDFPYLRVRAVELPAPGS
jgi:hypothetical protein